MGRSQYLVVRTFQEVASELPGRPGRILKNQNVYILVFGRHGALLLIIISVCFCFFCRQFFVWSQRAGFTLLFLMAELCRRRVQCVRAVGVNWVGSIYFGRTFQEVTSGLLRFLFVFFLNFCRHWESN